MHRKIQINACFYPVTFLWPFVSVILMKEPFYFFTKNCNFDASASPNPFLNILYIINTDIIPPAQYPVSLYFTWKSGIPIAPNGASFIFCERKTASWMRCFSGSSPVWIERRFTKDFWEQILIQTKLNTLKYMIVNFNNSTIELVRCKGKKLRRKISPEEKPKLRETFLRVPIYKNDTNNQY